MGLGSSGSKFREFESIVENTRVNITVGRPRAEAKWVGRQVLSRARRQCRGCFYRLTDCHPLEEDGGMACLSSSRKHLAGVPRLTPRVEGAGFSYPCSSGGKQKYSMYVCMYVCMYVFIKLHITTQSGPVILVILCHSHVCMYVCMYLLNCT